MRGGLQKSLLSPPFFTPLGSGSISRLFLAIRSLVFSAEWLFYQPLWLFSPSRLPAQCERGLDAPLSLHPPPPPLLFPCSISPPFPLLCSPLLEGLPSSLCVQMTRVIISTTANEFTPLQVSGDGHQLLLVFYGDT